MRQFALAILGVVVVGCSLNRSVTSASDTGPEGADADMDASDRGRDAAIDAGDAGGPSDVGVDVASGFMVYADRAADIPLRVGDAIDVMIDCTHGG